MFLLALFQVGDTVAWGAPEIRPGVCAEQQGDGGVRMKRGGGRETPREWCGCVRSRGLEHRTGVGGVSGIYPI